MGSGEKVFFSFCECVWDCVPGYMVLLYAHSNFSSRKKKGGFHLVLGSTNDLSFIAPPSNHMSRMSCALAIVVIDNREAKRASGIRIDTRFFRGIFTGCRC